VRRDPDALGSARMWLDAGTEDPFDPGDRALVAPMSGSCAGAIVRYAGGLTHND
jgi:hypothetical protein